MNKKGETNNNNAMVVILLAITIIIGMTLLGSIANSQALISEKRVVTNESDSLDSCYATNTTKAQIDATKSACNFTLDNAPTGWRLSDGQCALGSVVVTNSSGIALVDGTDYNMYPQTGILQMLNSSNTNSTFMSGNYTLLAYNFCHEGYLQNTGDRALIKLIVTFLSIVLLITAVSVARNMMQ